MLHRSSPIAYRCDGTFRSRHHTVGLTGEIGITAIGDVINGVHPGRTSAGDIALFDGTDVELPDLAVVSAAAKLAEERGMA